MALIAALAVVSAHRAGAVTSVTSGGCNPASAPAGYTAVQVATPSDSSTAVVAIPAGVSQISVDVCGAQGGEPAGYVLAGRGGETMATLSVAGPTQLDVVVGAVGTDVDGYRAFGGGGAGHSGGTPGQSYGGGGGSFIFEHASLTPIVIAGGGGGVYWHTDCGGGAGGGLTGGDALRMTTTNCNSDFDSGGTNAGGGTQIAGGAGAKNGACVGQSGTQFQGGDGSQPCFASGGGGGYYGGGGGGYFGDGGGGSGFITANSAYSASNTSNLTGVQSGNGAVRILYLTPASPPAFTSAPTTTGTVGSPYSSTVSVSASPTATISLASGTLPPGLGLIDNGNNTATISGTPTTAGSYAFTLQAGNGAPPDATQSDSIRISSATSTGGGGGAPAGSSPSPSPSASPTASPSTSPISRAALTLHTTTPDIQPGEQATLIATGAANQAMELRCYSRPASTYQTARTATIDAAGDPVVFALLPGTNTRCFAQYATDPAMDASGSIVITVHTTLSLSIIRDGGERNFVFQGRNLPRVAGQLVTVYRLTPNGEVRTANGFTDVDGIYRITRHFLGTGTFQFLVRTSATLNNGAGVSKPVVASIR